jgi:hypothetical protein
MGWIFFITQLSNVLSCMRACVMQEATQFKLCSICCEDKSLEEFGYRRVKGKCVPYSYCATCRPMKYKCGQAGMKVHHIREAVLNGSIHEALENISAANVRQRKKRPRKDTQV